VASRSGPGPHPLDRVTALLRRSRRWPWIVVCFVIVLAEVITLAMNTLNSWIWWGRVHTDLLLIGTIDSFVAAGFVGLVGVLMIRRAFDLQDINQRLQDEIDERLRTENERRMLKERLQQAERMEALGKLAGGVAHDLNNILSGLVGYPDWLLMELPPDSPLRPPLLTIRDSGERAAAVVQDLLTLARRGVRTDSVVSVNEVVTAYLTSPEFSRLVEAYPQVTVETRLEAVGVGVRGSAVQLRKSLMNLVTNAFEAVTGAGRILVETDRVYVDTPVQAFETIPPGHYVSVGVSDTGEGIAPLDLPRVFEPFYTKKAMGRSGTGLGLAVVWGHVKDHSGYVDVRTTPGEGTTFRLFLPATAETVAPADSSDADAMCRGRGETVLVVDDLEEQRALASGLLTRLGYVTSVAGGGEEAVEYLTSRRADVVLLDMIMDPGPDGLETYARIVALHPRQRAVIASGFAETGRVRKAISLGAGTYLRKPYTAARLGRAIRRELDRVRPTD
jgi:two-component system, cell cycle sensor histidine kinase and response regulator CckA